MRTRTAPSERPSTPAISAVDISSTKRRISARRRSPGSRSTAREGRGRLSAADCVGLEVGRRGDGDRGIERRLRAAADPAATLGDRIPGDLEEPDPERGRAIAVVGPGALLEPAEIGQRREERPFRGVLCLVMVAQFVEGVAVHLGEVLPIQGLEPGRVRLGRLHEPPVAIEVGKARIPPW